MTPPDDPRDRALAHLHACLGEIRGALAATQADLDAGRYGPRRARKAARRLPRLRAECDRLEALVRPPLPRPGSDRRRTPMVTDPCLNLAPEPPSPPGNDREDAAPPANPFPRPGQAPERPAPWARRVAYLAALRAPGGLPRGWQAARAREWGITEGVICREVAAAREHLAWERSPEGCRAAAHGLVMQAVRAADLLEQLASAPPPASLTSPGAIRAWNKATAARAARLKTAANGKLKTAAALTALSRAQERPAAGGPGR